MPLDVEVDGTILQFQSAYRRLLVFSHIQASVQANGNILDATLILRVGAGRNNKPADSLIDEEDEKKIMKKKKKTVRYITCGQ